MKKILIPFLLLACTIFMFLQMRPTAKKLKTPETQSGILNLEFAYDNYHTSKVLNAWKKDDKINAAKQNTYIDFGFLFFVFFFLFYCCSNLSKSFTGKISSLGILLSKAALTAGALDVFENIGMLITLGGYQHAAVALLTAICASIKWLFAGFAILFIIFISPAALYIFLKKIKQLYPK